MNLRHHDTIASHDFKPNVGCAERVPRNHDQVVREKRRIIWNVSESFEVTGTIVTVEILNWARAFETTCLIEHEQPVRVWRIVHREQTLRRHKRKSVNEL